MSRKDQGDAVVGLERTDGALERLAQVAVLSPELRARAAVGWVDRALVQ